MTTFAKVENGIVVHVECVTAEFMAANPTRYPGEWVETFIDGSKRGNYAGKGYTFNKALDAFYAPKPYASWMLDESYKWQAPVPVPIDGKRYAWDEKTISWKVIT